MKKSKSNSNSLQSPFSDVCCLHMTLTNKCFQNACGPLEDMVRIRLDMANRLLVSAVQRISLSSAAKFFLFSKARSAQNSS